MSFALPPNPAYVAALACVAAVVGLTRVQQRSQRYFLGFAALNLAVDAGMIAGITGGHAVLGISDYITLEHADPGSFRAQAWALFVMTCVALYWAYTEAGCRWLYLGALAASMTSFLACAALFSVHAYSATSVMDRVLLGAVWLGEGCWLLSLGAFVCLLVVSPGLVRRRHPRPELMYPPKGNGRAWPVTDARLKRQNGEGRYL